MNEYGSDEWTQEQLQVSCPRSHLLFKIIAEGIAIKCRGCRAIHIVTWAELDARRKEVEQCAILAEKQEVAQ